MREIKRVVLQSVRSLLQELASLPRFHQVALGVIALGLVVFASLPVFVVSVIALVVAGLVVVAHSGEGMPVGRASQVVVASLCVMLVSGAFTLILPDQQTQQTSGSPVTGASDVVAERAETREQAREARKVAEEEAATEEEAAVVQAPAEEPEIEVEPTSEAEPVEEPAPEPGPEERVQEILDEEFGSGFLGSGEYNRLREVEVSDSSSGQTVRVHYDARATRDGDLFEMADINEVLYTSDLDIAEVRTVAYDQLVNTRTGEEFEEVVWETSLSAVDAAQINWENSMMIDWDSVLTTERVHPVRVG